MTETAQEALECLKRRRGVTEACHVERFELYALGEDGRRHSVVVEVHDFGPDSPRGFRYRVTSSAADGSRTCTMSDRIEKAINILHFPEPPEE
jgi:hypothetical protein